MTMILHNYKFRQFHRTSIGINPSSGFRYMGSANSGPSAAWFDKFLVHWASPYGANGQITMTLHNYRTRQVHETLNGVNPSSSVRDMRSASLDPICGKFDKFLAPAQAHMGKMGKWPWQCTTTGIDNSTELRMEKIHQAVTEIWVPQLWQPPARPPARTVTTIPLQPEGLRGKKVWQAERQTVILLKENSFENVICKMLAFFSGLNIGLFDAYFSSRYIINQS